MTKLEETKTATVNDTALDQVSGGTLVELELNEPDCETPGADDDEGTEEPSLAYIPVPPFR